MTLDLDRTLNRIQERQWALADFEWDAPGADRITDEQRPALTAFMADLVWIEHVGARGFAALSRQTSDPTLAAIYRYCHAEEQRHANAEMALMHRWGMLEDGKVPPPNVSIRFAMAWLDASGDDLPLSLLSAAIPLLEVALDGALLKFLLDEVSDPMCHEVFERVNNDESRHLAVGFEVMDRLGARPLHRQLAELATVGRRPLSVVGVIAGIPLMTRMIKNVEATGLDSERLIDAARRYEQIGNRGDGTRKNPIFHVLKGSGRVMADRSHPMHRVGDVMASVSDRCPEWLVPGAPGWAGDITYEPVA